METNKYSQSKIYKMTCGDLVYYGSTCEPMLSRRLSVHRCFYRQWIKNKKQYYTVFKLFDIGDPEITLVESVNCSSRDELRARERFHIENNDCVNKNIPTRSSAEYYKTNQRELYDRHAERYREYSRQYYKDHKEQCLSRLKERYENNKDYHKEYYQRHSEKYIEYGRNYRQNKKSTAILNGESITHREIQTEEVGEIRVVETPQETYPL